MYHKAEIQDNKGHPADQHIPNNTGNLIEELFYMDYLGHYFGQAKVYILELMMHNHIVAH